MPLPEQEAAEIVSQAKQEAADTEAKLMEAAQRMAVEAQTAAPSSAGVQVAFHERTPPQSDTRWAELEPAGGIEPSTCCLQDSCSAN